MLTFLSILVSVMLSLFLPAAWAIDQPFAVIAAPDVAEHYLTHESISLIFRRKQNYWGDGTRIQPVNLPPANPLRRVFSQSMLGHLPEDLEDYWREMYFHGVLPPHVLASEKAIIIFVHSTPGAIGYVSICVPNHGVNVVLMVGEVPTCSK